MNRHAKVTPAGEIWYIDVIDSQNKHHLISLDTSVFNALAREITNKTIVFQETIDSSYLPLNGMKTINAPK